MSGLGEPTLRALLQRADLGLRLVSDETALEEHALDTPLRWVHNSDLVDPTAFLVDGLLLLTTGTQFTDDDAIVGYVGRLAARGVHGLGFGTEVVRDGMPEALVAACAAARMPLLEVPYRTPFIAVARANAEAIAAQSYARRTWALDAQRAISRAALRPDGLRATVTELAHQLDGWVGLFDATGSLIQQHPADVLGAPAQADLATAASRLLRGRAGAGARITADGRPFSLQTVGHGGRLSGVIATSGEPPASEARDLVTSVAALAELALAHNVALAGAHDALREALATLLLRGHPEVVTRVAAQAWGPLPAEPVTVAWATVDVVRLTALADHLADGASTLPVFFGRADEGMLIVSADPDLPGRVADGFDAAVGVSTPTGYDQARAAYREARAAHGRSRTGVALRFDDVASAGMLGALHTPDARALAAGLLGPVREYDRRHATTLESTLRAWLDHDARLDATARALGIHRHTARARVQHAERLLGTDLSALSARAQLWAAFNALD